MAEPEYPVLRELETKLKLQWIDTDDYLATQRAIIEVTPDHAYLELPRGRKGDKGDPGNAISIQGIVAADSQLPANAEIGHAYVNTTTKGLAVWNGAQWFKVDNFAGVDADVQQFSRWFAQIESDARRAVDAADRAETAAEEAVQQVEGDFATRSYVDSKAWDKPAISDADTTRTPGAYRTNTASSGTPSEANNTSGVLEVLPSGANSVYQRFTTWGLNPEVWGRAARDGTSWYPWQLQPKPSTFNELVDRVDSLETTGGTSPSPSAIKEVPLLLTAGVGDSAGAPDGGTYRIIGDWGVPIKRWRICISTRNPRYNMAGATGVSLRRVTVARHAGNGATRGENTNVLTSTVSLDDHGPWKSGWVNAPIDANAEYAFGIQYAGTPPLLEGYGFRLPTGTNPQTQSVTGTATNRVPFDVWIEAETYASTPTIAGIGDSTMVGAGATREVVDSWLGLYAREIGALPVHYAASGDSAYNWLRKLDGYQMTRWSHLAQPDAVIFALGNNDMNTTTDGLSMAERVEQLIPYVRRRVGANLYAATVKPRRTLTSDAIATRTAYTNWLNGGGKQHFRDVFDFHAPVAIGDLLDPQYDSGDGTHLNDAGYEQLAGALDTSIISPAGYGALAAYMKGKGL